MKIQYCPYCGKKLDEEARFCKNCGKPISPFMQETQNPRQEQQHEGNPTERKTVYEGYIYKCPNCGNPIGAYEMVCSSCGYEIRGRHITSVVHEFALKLEKIDDPQKKDELIQTFYIPNTKEDIYDFFTLAHSLIKIGGTNTNTWMIKLEQAYQKAELSFGGTKEFERLKQMYEEAQIMNKKNSRHSFWKEGVFSKPGYAGSLIICLIGLLSFLINLLLNTEIFSFLSGCVFTGIVITWIYSIWENKK